MKAGLIRLVVVGMMFAGVCSVVAEQAAPGAAPKAAKEKDSAKVVKGVLSAPATNAVADVVAVLAAKGKEAKSYALTATDAEVVAKIKELTTKGVTVKVTGEANKDGTSLAVTKIEEVQKKK